MDYTYGLFIYNDLAGLDLVGPMDVFNVSNYILQKGRTITVSETTSSIRCIGGLEIVPGATIETAPHLDVLLVPGAESESIAGLSESSIQWIRQQAEHTKFVTSVCTGAFVLQRAGILSGRKATTHWMEVDDLAKDESIEVLPEMRYIRDGKIVTSQGGSAGIDMALWIVGQLHSPEHALEVKRFIQYEPAPPYTAIV